MVTAPQPLKLTKTVVDRLPVPARGEAVVMDSMLPGFGVRALPSGRKTYFVRYRTSPGRNAKQRRLSIGPHGVMTTEEAREAARKTLAQSCLGEDPAGMREIKKRERTVAKLLDEWFAGPCKRNRRGDLRPQMSIDYDRNRINAHVRPLIGKLRLSELDRVRIEKLRDDVAAGKTALRTKTKPRGVSNVAGGEGAATRTLRTLSSILSYAVDAGYLETNPCLGVRKTPDKARERFLSETEAKRLGEALRTAESEGVNAQGLAVIRLLLLSGARKSEIEGLRWDEIDAERGLIRKKRSKTGPKVMMLSAPMRAIIEAQPRRTGSPWVFPARSGDDHYVGTPRIWSKIREMAGVDDVRLHDLRHSAASFALASGLSLELIGGLLGHAQPRTTARYAHLADDDLHRASDKTAKAIGKLLGA